MPAFNTNEGTEQSACWRQPAQSSKGTHTTVARIDVASNAGPRTAVFHKITTGDKWPAPARRLTQNTFGRFCVENRRQNLDPSPMATNKPFFSFGRRAYDAAGNFSPPRPRIHLISLGPSSTFTVALPDTKRVGGGLILCQDQRPIVA